MNEHVLAQVGQKAIIIHDDLCLILEGASRPGTWDLPGGRIHDGELTELALRRELIEELGLSDCTIGDAFYYDLWYRPSRQTICLIANMVYTDEQQFTVSAEHIRYEWVTCKEAESRNFFTPIMLKMIQTGFEQLNKNDR